MLKKIVMLTKLSFFRWIGVPRCPYIRISITLTIIYSVIIRRLHFAGGFFFRKYVRVNILIVMY